MKTLKELIDAATEINAFSARFHTQYYHAPAKAWKFSRNAIFGDVTAMVGDDEGGPITEADHKPVGALRLTVDIERFRHDDTPAEADAARQEIRRFCESLGFKVDFESNVGSGTYGPIDQLTLT